MDFQLCLIVFSGSQDVLKKIAKALGQTWDIVFFAYFLSQAAP